MTFKRVFETGAAIYGTKVFRRVTDEEYRKSFAVMVSQMDEPERTRMNMHHRRAIAEKIENQFVRLMMSAVEGRPGWEQMEYFMYVAFLEWDTVRHGERGNIHPSVKEEMAKLEHDPVTEWIERSGAGVELNRLIGNANKNMEERYKRLHERNNPTGWRKYTRWLWEW